MGFPDSSVGKESAYNMQETPARFLGQEDPLEKGKAMYRGKKISSPEERANFDGGNPAD